MSLVCAPPRLKPRKHTGLRHVKEAAGYSMGGLRRLFGEAAFRHELVFGAVLLAALAYLRAPLSAFLLQGGALLVLVAFEAVNTAIELIVDRLSPDWSAFAKHAKDLGSLAVACLLLANLGPLAYTIALNVGAG